MGQNIEEVTRTTDNRRIARNTILLYIRMLVMMLVSLFTSRVVLAALGVEDYGICNVVGGIVVMFGFINSAMTTSTQRFITYELGRNDTRRLRLVFMTSIQIHLAVAAAVVILAETAGLWLLVNKMVIPAERMTAAMWIYQFSILSAVISIISFPFNADIVAHEKMEAFAYISILDVIMKLIVAYTLYAATADKLITYSILMLVTQVILTSVYMAYCHRNFDEARLRRMHDWKLIKEIGTFAGWNMWGNIAYILFTQGLNILLNMFFGPAVNAARGVAVQVQSAIMQFSGNFQMALNPQITKTYACGDLAGMHMLVFRSSRFTFLLLLCLSMPVMLEAETILAIWLKDVPKYTPVFLRLKLCISIIDASANPLMVSAAATGNVKTYQTAVGGILLSILPISYIVLKAGAPPYAVFAVHLCICITAFIVRLLIVSPMIKISIRSYSSDVICRCLAVAALSAAAGIMVKTALAQTLWNSVITCLTSLLAVAAFAYLIGITRHERDMINGKIKKTLSRI